VLPARNFHGGEKHKGVTGQEMQSDGGRGRNNAGALAQGQNMLFGITWRGEKNKKDRSRTANLLIMNKLHGGSRNPQYSEKRPRQKPLLRYSVCGLSRSAREVGSNPGQKKVDTRHPCSDKKKKGCALKTYVVGVVIR